MACFRYISANTLHTGDDDDDDDDDEDDDDDNTNLIFSLLSIFNLISH
jgi:hypothetical protein